MRIFLKASLILFIIGSSCQSNKDIKVINNQWASFRGPNAYGVMDNANIPTTFDSVTNIKWKTKIPGLGHSCPIIWDDYLFVTTAISGQKEEYLKIGLYGDIDAVNDTTVHQFKVYCLDKNTGEIIWEKLAHKGVPKTKRHTKASHANPTPATDGKHLVAFFGSDGMYCYTLNGDLLWSKDFGKMNAGPYNAPSFEWGFASSPVIHNDKIYVQCDYIGGSYIAVLDIKTGNEIWKTERGDVSTWSSPTVIEVNGKFQVVANGYKEIASYDAETGKKIWWMHGGGDAPVPTPILIHDLIFINNAHGKMSPIYAIKKTAKGDITLRDKETSNEHIAWSIKRGGSYMQSPLVYGNYLYNMRGNGLLSCFNAKTGELIYKEGTKPGCGITASGLASDGHLFFSTEKGDVYVIKAGPTYELVAKNSLGDIIMATPAISNGTMFFRTMNYVMAVSYTSL